MIKIDQLSRAQWQELEKDAHGSVFGEVVPDNLTRVDFAMLAANELNQPILYATCRELDAESLYWQYGGSFPRFRGQKVVYTAFCEMISWTKKYYKRLSFLVENDNKAMLRLAMGGDFKIVGVRNFKNKVLLEHALEF